MCAVSRETIPKPPSISDSTVPLERPTMNVPIKRQVSFDKIQIREYAPAIGDHPSVSNGVPIALGNRKVREIDNVPIDIYESIRQPLRRKNSKQLLIKPNVRAELLLSEGYEKKDINKAAIVAHEAKTSIQKSARSQSWDGFNEKLENTTRLFTTVSRRPFIRKSSSFSE